MKSSPYHCGLVRAAALAGALRAAGHGGRGQPELQRDVLIGRAALQVVRDVLHDQVDGHYDQNNRLVTQRCLVH